MAAPDTAFSPQVGGGGSVKNCSSDSGSDCDSSEGHWEVVVGWGQPDAGAGQTSLEEWRAAQEDLPRGNEAAAETRKKPGRRVQRGKEHERPRVIWAENQLSDLG